jgi:pimeloyl-ACP methyl ester carboxylesterase
LGDHDIEYINWIEPKPNEPLRDYTTRLFKDLPKEESRITLIGHSFGAIASQEIATVRNIEKIILISSIRSSQELPTSFRFINPLNLHKLFTKEFSINTMKYWGKNRGFGNRVEQELFKNMIEKHSNKYLQWALKSICQWKTPKLPARTQLYQLHGSNDKTFPVKYIKKPDVIIENGNHIMVYDQAQKISEILKKEINASRPTMH